MNLLTDLSTLMVVVEVVEGSLTQGLVLKNDFFGVICHNDWPNVVAFKYSHASCCSILVCRWG